MIPTSDKWCLLRFLRQSVKIGSLRYVQYMTIKRMEWKYLGERDGVEEELMVSPSKNRPSRLQRPLGPSSAGNRLFQYMHGASLSIAVLEALRRHLYSGIDHHRVLCNKSKNGAAFSSTKTLSPPSMNSLRTS